MLWEARLRVPRIFQVDFFLHLCLSQNKVADTVSSKCNRILACMAIADSTLHVLSEFLQQNLDVVHSRIVRIGPQPYSHGIQPDTAA